MDNIFVVYHRSTHHASKSGYGRLIDFLDAKVVYGTTKFPFRIAKLFAKLYANKKGEFNTGSLLKLIELYFLLKKHKRDKNTVHFLNGERDIRHLGFFKRKFPNTYFCATFHKPPEILKKTITDNSSLIKLDGAIGVGINQIDFLKEWLKLDNVSYIPHGVDTHFFVPSKTRPSTNTILFVGQHLRDFDNFNKCVPIMAKKIKDLKINVIIHPSFSKKINNHKSITVYKNVNDEELLEFYQQSKLLFLPLLNVTACNSILEALACGLPIITSEVGGNNVYIEGTANIAIAKSKTEAYIESVTELIKNEKKILKAGISSRTKALEFEWKIVAQKVNRFYKEIAEENIRND